MFHILLSLLYWNLLIDLKSLFNFICNLLTIDVYLHAYLQIHEILIAILIFSSPYRHKVSSTVLH